MPERDVGSGGGAALGWDGAGGDIPKTLCCQSWQADRHLCALIGTAQPPMDRQKKEKKCYHGTIERFVLEGTYKTI